jgi:hypothetical protein
MVSLDIDLGTTKCGCGEFRGTPHQLTTKCDGARRVPTRSVTFSWNYPSRILGIDVGGVIIGGDGEDTSFFSDNYLQTPQLENAIEVIARVRPRFDNTFIISKCGPKVESKTMAWMRHHDFHNRTEIGETAFHFCRKRPEKVGIAKKLGVTHYIDNRMDIINSMIGTVPNLFLFNPLQRATVTQGPFHIVPSWAAFERLLEVLDKRSKA